MEGGRDDVPMVDFENTNSCDNGGATLSTNLSLIFQELLSHINSRWLTVHSPLGTELIRCLTGLLSFCGGSAGCPATAVTLRLAHFFFATDPANNVLN